MMSFLKYQDGKKLLKLLNANDNFAEKLCLKIKYGLLICRFIIL